MHVAVETMTVYSLNGQPWLFTASIDMAVIVETIVFFQSPIDALALQHCTRDMKIHAMRLPSSIISIETTHKIVIVYFYLNQLSEAFIHANM